MKKKKCVKKKRRKKKRCRNWNGLGYCPTVSQYNGKLYCDTAGFGSAVGSVVLQYGGQEGWFGLGERRVTIQFLYHILGDLSG